MAEQVASKLGQTFKQGHEVMYATKNSYPADVPTLLDPLESAARKHLRPFFHMQKMRSGYRWGQNPEYPPSSGVAYPDVMELRSVSPAAKRVICMDRWFREREEEFQEETRVYAFFGIPRKLVRWWKGEEA